jgi:hypothetical protein
LPLGSFRAMTPIVESGRNHPRLPLGSFRQQDSRIGSELEPLQIAIGFVSSRRPVNLARADNRYRLPVGSFRHGVKLGSFRRAVSRDGRRRPVFSVRCELSKSLGRGAPDHEHYRDPRRLRPENRRDSGNGTRNRFMEQLRIGLRISVSLYLDVGPS